VSSDAFLLLFSDLMLLTPVNTLSDLLTYHMLLSIVHLPTNFSAAQCAGSMLVSFTHAIYGYSSNIKDFQRILLH
jgi:hypothetical protein